MSGSSTPAPERDTHLLSVGKQCTAPSCLLVDFLPFKCQHCEQPFCADHYKVAAHQCPKYDESRYNRVAPNCPLCNEPVAVRPGQDPNIRMDHHISNECSVMTGKTNKTKSAPVCARGKCGKVLFAPIGCSQCKKQYCPEHRFPGDHNCSASTKPSSSKPFNSTISNPMSKLNAKATAAVAFSQEAARKALSTPSSSAGTVSPPLKQESSASSPKSIAGPSNPFSKTDRSAIIPPNVNDHLHECKSMPDPVIDPIRAKAERESRRKAMMERHKKGLLSEQEKLLLATEEAERQNVGEKKGECFIM